MFTRTITTYNAIASRVYKEAGVLKEEVYGSCTFTGTAASKAAARKALLAAGVQCPKGCYIEVEELESKVYGCTVDEFMSVAHPVADER